MQQTFAQRPQAPRPRPDLEPPFHDDLFVGELNDQSRQRITEIQVNANEIVERIDASLAENIVQPLGEIGIRGQISESQSIADSTEEDLEMSEELSRETYNRSLRRVRELGAVALGEHIQPAEVYNARESVKRDWLTSLAEILENEEEFRGRFEINDVYEYSVIDGHVSFATANGPIPMRQMIRDGAARSRAEAEADPRMRTQAERDMADLFNADRVDIMAQSDSEPNSRLVVSRDLGGAIERHREFWEQKGYRKGLAFLQLYYVADGKVAAGTFSVDNVSDEIFDKVLAEYGVFSPAGDNNNGVRYGVERSHETKEDAIAFAQAFRARCYELSGDNKNRQSVNELLDTKKVQLDAVFDSLCMPLAKAAAFGKNNQQVQQFVQGLLAHPEHLKQEVVAQLYRISGSDEIDDSDSRLLLGLSLYAATEMLFKEVKQPKEQQIMSHAAIPPEQILSQLVGFVHIGAAAGRSHGGSCAGDVGVAKSKENDSSNPQAAYGVSSEESSKEEDEGPSDKFGRLDIQCSKGHWNRRKFARTPEDFLKNCKVCSISLACGEDGSNQTSEPNPEINPIDVLMIKVKEEFKQKEKKEDLMLTA